MNQVLFPLFLLTFLIVPGVVFAGPCDNYCTQLNAGASPTPVPGITCICNPLETTSFTGIIDNILTLLFNFAIVIAPLMAVIAGIMFVTAAGNPAQISRAKQILIWTAVGFGIVLLSKGLIAVLQQFIGI